MGPLEPNTSGFTSLPSGGGGGGAGGVRKQEDQIHYGMCHGTHIAPCMPGWSCRGIPYLGLRKNRQTV